MDMEEIGRVCSTCRSEETSRQVSFGQSEEKRPLEIYRRGWKDNIKMGSMKIEWNNRK
jgi:hypothetical protein